MLFYPLCLYLKRGCISNANICLSIMLSITIKTCICAFQWASTFSSISSKSLKPEPHDHDSLLGHMTEPSAQKGFRLLCCILGLGMWQSCTCHELIATWFLFLFFFFVNHFGLRLCEFVLTILHSFGFICVLFFYFCFSLFVNFALILSRTLPEKPAPTSRWIWFALEQTVAVRLAARHLHRHRHRHLNRHRHRHFKVWLSRQQGRKRCALPRARSVAATEPHSSYGLAADTPSFGRSFFSCSFSFYFFFLGTALQPVFGPASDPAAGELLNSLRNARVADPSVTVVNHTWLGRRPRHISNISCLSPRPWPPARSPLPLWSLQRRPPRLT